MTRVPIPGGRPCIFRVVRVSGTIRKVEEEAIRRAKLLVLAAKDEMSASSGKGPSALESLLRGGDKQKGRAPTLLGDQLDVDSDDQMSDG